MQSLDRRQFLRAGVASMPFVAAAEQQLTAQPSANRNPPADDTSPLVHMVGDGLSLTPEESAQLWMRLTSAGDITPDSYSNGGTVEELERQFASALGKERAVFMPTGTLANQLAVRVLAEGPSRAIVQAESHLFNDSGDCMQTLSGITLLPLGAGRASFTLEEVTAALARAESGRVMTPVSVISVESPVRRRYGETFDQRELDRIVAFAKREGIKLHLDGARLFLQSAYSGVSVAEYSEPFDTVYVSLYKYFNAVSGAILAGPRDLLDDMYHTRRMFGAGLPGAWPFAAVARHHLPGFIERFRQAVAMSEQWVAAISRHTAFAVERIPSGTNILRLRMRQGDPADFRARLGRRRIQLGRVGPDGTSFLVSVNETWNRMTPEELTEHFIDALSA